MTMKSVEGENDVLEFHSARSRPIAAGRMVSASRSNSAEKSGSASAMSSSLS